MKILITGGLGHIGSYLIENIGKIKFVKKLNQLSERKKNFQ